MSLLHDTFKLNASQLSWRNILDEAIRQGGGRLSSIQTYFESEKADLLVDNPETGNHLAIKFNPISFGVDEIIAEVRKRIDEDNAVSATRRVSVKAGTLAEKAAILANMAKTLSELSFELDALVARKKE